VIELVVISLKLYQIGDQCLRLGDHLVFGWFRLIGSDELVVVRGSERRWPRSPFISHR